MRAGVRIWRASASASLASGTAPGPSPTNTRSGYGDGELDGGVREVAAGTRETSRLFGQAASVFERPGSVRDVRGLSPLRPAIALGRSGGPADSRPPRTCSAAARWPPWP
jgi:hypothetical protein